MSNISHDVAAQRFSTQVDGETAELTYELRGEVMSITHTYVPPAIAGRGIAAQLMGAALEAAQQRHWNVNPVCSYAAAFMRKHPATSHHLDELLDEALDESFPASDSPSVGGSN